MSTIQREENFSSIRESNSMYKEREMTEQELKYQKAKGRVEALRKFYIHLCVYVLVNLSLFLRNILISPDNLWFFWPLLGWGIAIVIHAFSVFGAGGLLGADWEKRKIQEMVEKQ